MTQRIYIDLAKQLKAISTIKKKDDITTWFIAGAIMGVVIGWASVIILVWLLL